MKMLLNFLFKIPFTQADLQKFFFIPSDRRKTKFKWFWNLCTSGLPVHMAFNWRLCYFIVWSFLSTFLLIFRYTLFLCSFWCFYCVSLLHCSVCFHLYWVILLEAFRVAFPCATEQKRMATLVLLWWKMLHQIQPTY